MPPSKDCFEDSNRRFMMAGDVDAISGIGAPHRIVPVDAITIPHLAAHFPGVDPEDVAAALLLKVPPKYVVAGTPVPADLVARALGCTLAMLRQLVRGETVALTETQAAKHLDHTPDAWSKARTLYRVNWRIGIACFYSKAHLRPAVSPQERRYNFINRIEEGSRHGP